MTNVITQDEKFGITMLAIMRQANETGAPVLFTVEGHGDMVIMPANAYADQLDRIQTVGEVTSGPELFDDPKEDEKG